MINQTWITKRVDGIAKDIHSIANSLEVLANEARDRQQLKSISINPNVKADKETK